MTIDLNNPNEIAEKLDSLVEEWQYLSDERGFVCRYLTAASKMLRTIPHLEEKA